MFVDIDPVTFNIDPALHRSGASRRGPRAIVPVHLHGRPADMDPILEIAERHGLAVIEDAAQAHGAEYQGRRVGTHRADRLLQLLPGQEPRRVRRGRRGRHRTTTTVAHTVRVLRDWGAERRYHHDLKGFNYRMEGVQGAVLGVKMAHIEAWTEARRAARRALRRACSRAAASTLPARPADRRHVYHVYAVRTAEREALQRTSNGTASGRASTTRSRCTSRRRFAELGHTRVTSRTPSAPPTSCCRCRCTRRCPTEHVEQVAALVNDVGA